MKLVLPTWNGISKKVEVPQLVEEVEQWTPWEGSWMEPHLVNPYWGDSAHTSSNGLALMGRLGGTVRLI